MWNKVAKKNMPVAQWTQGHTTFILIMWDFTRLNIDLFSKRNKT